MKLDPEWPKTVAEIRQLWPKWETNETQLGEWTGALGRHQQAVVRLAVARHYHECNYREPRLSAVIKHVASILRQRVDERSVDSAEAKRVKLAKHDSSVQVDQAGMRRELAAFPAPVLLEFLQVARAMCGKTLGEEVFTSSNADLKAWTDAAVGLAWAAMKCGASLDDTKTREGRQRVAELARQQVLKLDEAA